MRTGRPLRADVERPPCPRQHESRTLLDGHYRSPDGRYERPRYRCVDLTTGKTLHRFGAPMPRRHHRNSSGRPHMCDACERPLRRNDGPVAPRRFGYAIRDIADILVRAGRGEVYREIAADVRDQLGRVAADGAIKGAVGKSASPVIHAIDVFAPLVMGLGVPERWPAIVAIDALPLRARHRKKRGPKPPPWPASAKKKRKRKPRPGTIIEIGRILVAAGKDDPADDWKPLLFRFEGGGDEGAWTEFLCAMPGTPTWVVSDRDKAITNAVDEVWPGAIHYYSHYHLQKNAREWLARDKKLKARDRRHLDASIEFAFGSLRSFSRLTQDAMAAGATELLGWMRAARSTHREQLIKQIGYEAYPKSASGVENHIKTIKAAVESRRHHFTNVDRLNKLLGLVRNRVARRGRVEDYARLIRAWVEQHEGRVEADWDAPMDSWTVRSLDLVIAEAELRRKGIQSARQAPLKAARYRRGQAAYDAKRAALGLPPRPRGLPRPIKAKGSVAGTFVSDYPWLMFEWHPTRNAGVDPRTVPAGTGKHLWWKCPNGPDHEWHAQVRSRTVRGVRCPFCTHRMLAPSESFASTHPDIAAEWHPTRNRDKTPADFTFGSHFEAWWQCPDYKTHVYQARINSRTSMMSGCRKCADLRRRKKPPPRITKIDAAA